MIKIKVIDSPDLDMIGEHIYYQNLLSIGRDKGNILINDRHILNSEIEFVLSQKGLFARPKNIKKDTISVNNKEIKGTKFLGTGDQLKVGQTIIQVEDYFYDDDILPSEIIKRNIRILFQENSPINTIIDILEKKNIELKKSEK